MTVDPSVEEVHVHGYEIDEPAAKSPVRFAFPADIDGLFEIEATTSPMRRPTPRSPSCG